MGTLQQPLPWDPTGSLRVGTNVVEAINRQFERRFEPAYLAGVIHNDCWSEAAILAKEKQRLEFLILYHMPEVWAAFDDLVRHGRAPL